MTAVAETTARSAEKYRVTRSRRNVAWTGLGALVVVVVLALFPYLVGAGTETILVQAFIILTLASMWNLMAGYAGLVSVGQQAFVGLGAYFVLILAQHGTSPFSGLPVAAIGCRVRAGAWCAPPSATTRWACAARERGSAWPGCWSSSWPRSAAARPGRCSPSAS